MSRSGKLYANALKYHNDGNLDKAAELCDKCIALDMHAPSMNLRGLIYYINGELDNAERIWRMNSSANNDSVSRKYLKDAQSDKKRIELFNEGVDLYDNVNVSKAFEILKQCSESDFNCINVNNYLASCCIKLGDYNSALKFTQKVLTFDKKNIIAKNNRKIIAEFGGVREKGSSKPILYISTVLIGFMLAAVFYNMVAKSFGKSFRLQSKSSDYKVAAVKKSSSEDNKISSGTANTKNAAKVVPDSSQVSQVFPSEDLKKNMDSGSFDALYEEVSVWKNKSLGMNESILLKKAIDLLSDKGVKYFYINGSSFNSSGDYASAVKYLSKAYEYGKNNYLYQSVLYSLAESLEKSSDAEAALKYYEEYDSSYYPKGEYEPTVLYNMAMLLKDSDMAKAKEYADKLSKTFPNSIYNNDNIKAME